MSFKLESPVQTQTAVAVLKSPLNSDYHTDNGTDRKPGGRRRVFVPTESRVLGTEVDRRDNVQTVKRRLQLPLNVHTDKSSSTTLGDKIRKVDGNYFQQIDDGGPIEILGCLNHFTRINELVKQVVRAIKNGVEPLSANNGLGGAYYFRDINGECVAIVKPADEEPFAPNNPKGFLGKALGQPGLKRFIRVGETGFREVAAYLLDYNHFANVPPTALVMIRHSIFNVNDGVKGSKSHIKKLVTKIASLQQYIPHDFDAGDYGTSSFPVAAVHRIGILDIRIFNTDRHAGNLLVRKLDGEGRFGQVDLIPIDHGLCLPEGLEDPYFEWIHWPQASIPFSDDELEYIRNLDPVYDSEMLRKELPMIRESCLRVLVLCTIFLKEAADFGLCLAEIGGMMSREFRGHVEEPSELEVFCLEARSIAEERKMPSFDDELMNGEEVQFDMDLEEADSTPNVSRNKASFSSEFKSVNSQKSLSTLEESIEEEEIEVNEFQNISELSMSVKYLGLSEKSQRLEGFPSVGTALIGIRRSANELLPATTSFVRVADMSEEEWVLFLEKFKELLHPAFANRISSSICQRHRLGTSCQF